MIWRARPANSIRPAGLTVAVANPSHRHASGATEATAADIPLDDVLRFMRLIWAIDHELERVSKRMETSIGLTIPQRLSLLLIGQNPGVLASSLAWVLHLHRGTLSGIVQRLAAAGYIERKTDSRDGRRVGLTLTEAGRSVNRRRAGTFEEAVRRVLASTDSAELAAAERVLTKVGAELRRVGDSIG